VKAIRLESSSTRGSVSLHFSPVIAGILCVLPHCLKGDFSCSLTWFCFCQSSLLCLGQDALSVFLPLCLFWYLSCNPSCLAVSEVQLCKPGLGCSDGYIARYRKHLHVALGCTVTVLPNICMLVVLLFKCAYIWVPGKLILTIPRLIHLELSQNFSTSAIVATNCALCYYYL